MNSTSEWLVRPASAKDVPAIAAIADEHLLNGKDVHRRRGEGFLVSGYSATDYTAWVDHLTVATRSDAVGGFVLGFPRRQLPSSVQDAQQLLAQMRQEEFYLIKQVAVSVSVMGTGAGKLLYQHVLATRRGIAVCAAIILDPPNPRSVSFHEGLGFRPAFRFEGSDGKARGCWCHANHSIPRP